MREAEREEIVKRQFRKAVWAGAFVLGGTITGLSVSQGEPSPDAGLPAQTLDDLTKAMRPFVPAKANLFFDSDGTGYGRAVALRDALRRGGGESDVVIDGYANFDGVIVDICRPSNEKKGRAANAFVAGLKL